MGIDICEWILFILRPNLKNLVRGLKFKPQLKYGWFYLKLYLIFQDLSLCLIETGFAPIWDAA